MANNIKYRKFSELMSSVSSDIDVFADSGYIDEGKYIKIVRRVNSDLGININKQKEVILDVVNYKVILPADFDKLELALLCSEPSPITSVTDSVDSPKFVPHLQSKSPEFSCSSCAKNTCGPDGNITICGDCLKIRKYVTQDVTIEYKTTIPVKLTRKSHDLCSNNCFNLSVDSDKYKYVLDINEGEMTLSGIKEGKIFLSYLTDMVDEEGELIIVDHPLINDYYEYSVKERIFENIMLNSEADVSQKLMYIKNEKKLARIDAMNFAYMPEYTEILDYMKTRNNSFYNKYIKIFNRW
jgi:hypothetical protein